MWGVRLRLLVPGYGALLLAAWLNGRFAFLQLPFLDNPPVFLLSALWVLLGLVWMVAAALMRQFPEDGRW